MPASWTRIFNEHFLKELLIFSAVFLVVTIALLVVRNIFFRYSKRWIKETGASAAGIIP